MRKKNNLQQRILDCSALYLCKLFTNGEKIQLNNAQNITAGGFPATWLEIGCGKGGFVNKAAKLFPDINFLAAEKNENVIITAMERTKAEGLSNIRYIIGLAEYLERIIPPAFIQRIYLNFSCPFPKNRHEKHRLTSKGFLEIYKRILIPNGKIYFKTDNNRFFEYSSESFSVNGFLIGNFTRDLHNSVITGNIITEYEEYFIKKGEKINYLEAFLK